MSPRFEDAHDEHNADAQDMVERALRDYGTNGIDCHRPSFDECDAQRKRPYELNDLEMRALKRAELENK